MFLSIQPTNPNRILKLMTGILLVCVFGIAMLMSVTTARAGPADENGCHEHKEECGGGGSVDPTFEVMIDGDLLGEGDLWLRPSSGSSSIRYFAWEDPTKTYSIDLHYFRVLFDEGEKCFGPGLTETRVAAIDRQSLSGAAIATFLFSGTTTEPLPQPIDYSLVLEGSFDDTEANWPPREGEVNTVTLTTWELKLAPKKLMKKFSDISCVGEISDEEDFLTIMEVVRDP